EYLIDFIGDPKRWITRIRRTLGRFGNIRFPNRALLLSPLSNFIRAFDDNGFTGNGFDYDLALSGSGSRYDYGLSIFAFVNSNFVAGMNFSHGGGNGLEGQSFGAWIFIRRLGIAFINN